MKRGLLAVVALGGCGSSVAPKGCEEVTPAPLAACFGGDGVVGKGYGTVSLTTIATVESITTGVFPDGCDVRMGGESDDGAFLIALVTREGAHLTVGLATAGQSTPIATGDDVDLDASFTYGEFGPDLGWVGLTRWRGGSAVYTTAGAVADLHTPQDLALALGDAVCEVDDACGDWAAYELEATVDGVTRTVPYGAAADVEGWRVVHGGVEAQTEPGTSCPDYYVAHAEVLLLGG